VLGQSQVELVVPAELLAQVVELGQALELVVQQE
jgi:hypothetical protein